MNEPLYKKQRWSKAQIQEKVDMFGRHYDKFKEQADKESLDFFSERLEHMNKNQTKTITVDLNLLKHLQS